MSYDFKNICKHCNGRPHSEGPQHHPDCPRHDTKIRTDTELAHQFACKYCEAKPFIPGPHHLKDCPRNERDFTV